MPKGYAFVLYIELRQLVLYLLVIILYSVNNGYEIHAGNRHGQPDIDISIKCRGIRGY